MKAAGTELSVPNSDRRAREVRFGGEGVVRMKDQVKECSSFFLPETDIVCTPSVNMLWCYALLMCFVLCLAILEGSVLCVC